MKEIEVKGSGLLDGLSDGGKSIIAILFIFMILSIIGIIGILFYPNQNPPMQNSTINTSCDCDKSNYISYDIPLILPNMTALINDSNCNDYCYVQSCKYGCSQWVNFGLLNGRCQCDLQQCVINIREEVNDSYG